METYHALTPVAQPEPPPEGAADALAIAPPQPPALATDAEPEPTETLLLGGARFVDGVYVPSSAQVSAA